MAGWGQLLPLYFTSEAKIVNLAKGGASSNLFITEGRLDDIAGRLAEGDYVLIQFGHNDQKAYGTDPFTSYQAHLARYVKAVRAKQAFPVLLHLSTGVILMRMEASSTRSATFRKR